MRRTMYCMTVSSRFLPTFRSGENPRFVRGLRVMVTQSLDYLRREKRVSQLVVHEEQLPDIPDISSSGGGVGISEEQLMAFVAELPDGCRTVFNLYVFEEKPHKEIAKMLHIKEHSSTSQLHRAKYLLAKRIKEYRNHEERK